MMQHSNIVGGSTAKRVINCPGSVALVQKMPPKPSSKYADEGTLLHDTIAEHLATLQPLESFLGRKYQDQVLTQDLIDDKLVPALALLDEIDPKQEMSYEVETRVGFGDLLPGVFGSTDFVGRIGDRAVVLDWKFGDGVAVTAEENEQLMFYAAAAMRTDALKWAFEGATEIECVIVQPPMIRRWTTTPERIAQFERQLVKAVKAAEQPDAGLKAGDHCRWCAAKPVCPQMTGEVERAALVKIKEIDAATLGQYLAKADVLEGWITDLRALAFQLLEKNIPVPGYKIVQKQARRQWADETKAIAALHDMGVPRGELFSPEEIRSPAQIEKVLKKRKLALPDDLVKSVSSGTTLASEDDSRPAVLQLGDLRAAISKLQ
jgi:hypothetical protein